MINDKDSSDDDDFVTHDDEVGVLLCQNRESLSHQFLLRLLLLR
jgi:hypothetical protein